ncbi:MAG TPA: ABATE domain-containing protein [Acidimicrobiales bacterium]
MSSAVARPTLMEAAQSSGFMVGGEPLAVDLADTVVTVSQPPTDLLADKKASDRFWSLQAYRLPEPWRAPSLSDTRELRDAIRALLDAALSGAPFRAGALKVVNRVSGAVTTTLAAENDSGRLQKLEYWGAAQPADLALGAAARSAIELLSDPSGLDHLRRCANPNCSMLFVKGDARRVWCTPNICGNRTRVARHYLRHREPDLR